MATQTQRRQNVNDVNTSMEQYRSLIGWQLPRRRNSILSYSYSVSAKRGW